jgi:hypothetical protein
MKADENKIKYVPTPDGRSMYPVVTVNPSPGRVVPREFESNPSFFQSGLIIPHWNRLYAQ